MSLTADDIKKAAHLSRLALPPDELPMLTQKLSTVLQMINQLSELNTDAVMPLQHPLEMAQRLRDDRVTEPNMRDVCQRIAPLTEAGLYLVPQVIE